MCVSGKPGIAELIMSYLYLAAHSSDGSVSQWCPLKMQGQESTQCPQAARCLPLWIASTLWFRPTVTKNAAKLVPCWSMGFLCVVTGHHVQLTAPPAAPSMSWLFGFGAIYDLHDTSHHMIKSGHFCTYICPAGEWCSGNVGMLGSLDHLCIVQWSLHADPSWRSPVRRHWNKPF